MYLSRCSFVLKTCKPGKNLTAAVSLNSILEEVMVVNATLRGENAFNINR
jgi:hypothetical protein